MHQCHRKKEAVSVGGHLPGRRSFRRATPVRRPPPGPRTARMPDHTSVSACDPGRIRLNWRQHPSVTIRILTVAASSCLMVSSLVSTNRFPSYPVAANITICPFNLLGLCAATGKVSSVPAKVSRPSVVPNYQGVSTRLTEIFSSYSLPH